ncbi:MAG TPA: alpha/beta hydrolase [Humibacter sp.]|nr:alpha/beta hydrolase [Humibacter sp.]
MSEFAKSKDGTRVAYDREGTGPAVILVGGAMQFRGFDPTTAAMAGMLADRGFTVVNYDRRGRGESAGATSFALADELDDLAALIDEVGGDAALFGSSSGGAICLAAASAGLSVTKLALWEVPLGPENGTGGAEFFAGLRERLDAGQNEAAVEYYMKDMPPQWLAGAKASPGWPIMVGLAPSLSADAESLAWAQSGPHAQLLASVTQPVLVIVGSSTLPLMSSAADAIVAAVPNGRTITIEGENHSWQPDVMADTLAEFFAG